MKYIVVYLFLFLSVQYSMGQDTKLYDTEIYRNRIEEFKAKPLRTGQIVFLGNSLIQGGKWSEYYVDKSPANRGIIGNNTEGMLTLLSDIISASPEKLFFIGGVNDISQDKSNENILNNIKTIIKRVKKESPQTKIYVHSVLPINNSFERYKRLIGKEEQIKSLNENIKKLCKKEKVTFINLYPHFLDEEQQVLNPNYTTDGLHLNEKGYAVWVEQDRKFIEE